jgi:hypothetical protein
MVVTLLQDLGDRRKFFQSGVVCQRKPGAVQFRFFLAKCRVKKSSKGTVQRKIEKTLSSPSRKRSPVTEMRKRGFFTVGLYVSKPMDKADLVLGNVFEEMIKQLEIIG